MGVLALRLQSISDYEMAGLKVFLSLCCVVAAVNAVQLERGNRSRLIPADVLRDFRDSCFASTKCKVFGNQETWSLAPFCGQSKCVKLKSGRLAEEVTDCGPAVDLKATPGCQLLKGEADPKAEFPACCPVYDCEEGVEVTYVTPPAPAKKPAPAAPKTGSVAEP